MHPHLLSADELLGVLKTALAKGGDFAEVFVERTESTALDFEDGQLRSTTVGDSMGAGVRVIHQYHTGYAFTDELTPESLRRAAKTAAEIARAGKTTVRPLAEVAAADRYAHQKAAVSAPAKEKLHLLKAGHRALRAHDGCIKKIKLSYTDSRRHITIANSRGLMVSDVQPMVRLNANVVASRKGVTKEGTASYGGRFGLEFFKAHPPEVELLEAARVAMVNLDARPAPAGEMTVVVGPGWGGVLLHESVGHGLEADFILKKTSNYTGRLGERVASHLVSVTDDATLNNQRGSIAVDDEGMPGQTKVLIEKGVLKGYMYDLLSAWQLKQKSTGSGRRQSYRHMPMPRMTCTYMMGGKTDPAEIIAGTKRGVFAHSFTGGQVDISNGNFVFNMNEAYLIENGKISHSIEGATLIGNGPQILKSVDRVGNDSALDKGTFVCGKSGQSVPVNVGGPTLRIKNITVGGACR